MKIQVLEKRKLNFFRPRTLPAVLALAVAIPVTALAAITDLTLSDDALEVVIGVEPNVVILTDDSGSMDWGIMTDEINGVANQSDGLASVGTWLYIYMFPSPGATGSSPAAPIYGHPSYGVRNSYVMPTEESLVGAGVAPYGGVWRYWNSDYNKIYYNPDVTYVPWEGVDSNGNAYTDAPAAAAHYDPYYPGNGTLDLTSALVYTSICAGITGCVANVTKDDMAMTMTGQITVTSTSPAHYYVWTDANGTTPANADNGVIDDDDDHTLVEIKSAVANYTGRLAYSEVTETGRSDCTDNGDGTATCNYDEEIQNFANWFSYYRKRDLSVKAAASAAIEPTESARIGYATINNAAGDNLRVASMNVSPASGAKKTLLDKLFSTTPTHAFSQLRSGLDKTGKYFECASGDIFGSSGNSNPGDTDCPVEAAPAGQCQQNFAILMSDGYWNGSFGPPGVGNVDDNNTDWSGGAYADTISNTLADVAMEYYMNDLHGLADEVPATAKDIAGYLGSTDPFETMHQHMSTYTIGFGMDGTLSADPTDPTAAFTWPDPTAGDAEKIDDLRHAAYNGRGQFLSTADPVELATAMENIFSAIGTATGTATAVAFNTQEVEAGTLVFRASFNTKTHKGDLVAQQVNTDGTVDSTIIWSAAEQLDNKVAGASDSRVIITYKDTGDSTSAGIPFQWSDLTTAQQTLLNTPNNFGAERVGYLRGHDEDEGTNYAAGEFRQRPSVEGKLGDIVHSTPVFVGEPAFLGRAGGEYPPITDSDGAYVSGTAYSDFQTAWKDRTNLTYVGANDGMLHALKTADGSELFAYVPNLVVANLPDLTDPNYAHRYYVDLRPAINDAYFTPARGTNINTLSWNTVLVGGLAGGGKGYYALNVTDPDDLDTEADAMDNVMWEFTEADDVVSGGSDLGYSYSTPLIAMSNLDDGSGNQVWVAIFGNGYNSTSDDGDAILYILRLDGGQDGVWTLNTDYVKVSTENGNTEALADADIPDTPNGIGGIRGIDTNADGTVDYVYAGDLQGNLYRFDLSSTTMSSWTATPDIIFTAEYSPNDTFNRTIIQPITTRPIVVAHPSVTGEYIVIVTTGSWMTTDDATSTGIQSIYGIWDDMSGSPEVTMSTTTNQLVEQVFSNHVNTEHGYTVRTLTNNDVVWENSGSPGSKVKGWYIDLDVLDAATLSSVEYPGERAVRNLQIRGGIMFVNTIIPKETTACSTGAGGFELAFNPLTGGSVVDAGVIFDLDGDNNFGIGDNLNDTAGTANIITGIRFDTDTPTDSAFVGSYRMTQEGDTIRSFNTNTANDANAGRTSWREIID